jgi:synaptojanin
LNYRINLSYEETIELIKNKETKKLLNQDQLLIEKENGNIFKNYNESEIKFNPTYKYDKGIYFKI